jgi:Protein of unknown function (DUF3558)
MGRLLVFALAVTVTVAGCTTEAPGQPLPAPTDKSHVPPTSRRASSAPAISSPELDLTSYKNRVCDLLTLEQLAPFAINEPGKPKDGSAGPACTWNPPDSSTGARVDLDVLSKTEGGWQGIYDRRSSFPFFEDAGEINGYPAVHRDPDGNHSAEGICATTVGVHRDLVFDVGVFVNGLDSPEYRKACSVSDRVASAVIDTLKKGGR